MSTSQNTKTNLSLTEENSEKLDEALDLLKEVSADEMKNKGSRVNGMVDNVKSYAADRWDGITDFSKEKAEVIDQQVKDEPWKAVGVGALVAAAAGFLLGRKSKNQ